MRKIIISPNDGWNYVCKSKIKALFYVYKLINNNNIYHINITSMYFK